MKNFSKIFIVAMFIFAVCQFSFVSEVQAGKLGAILDAAEYINNIESAGRYIKAGRFSDAIDCCNEIIKRSPNFADAYTLRGASYFELKKYQEALSDTSKAISLDSSKTLPYIVRGRTYRELKNYQNALSDFEKVMQQRYSDDYSTAVTLHGLVNLDMNNYNAAVTDFSKVLEVEKNFANAYYNRGFANERLKKTNDAINDYSQAIFYEPNFAVAYLSRAFLYDQQEIYYKAVEDFTNAINKAPSIGGIYYFRGNEFIKLGKYNEAITDFNEFIKLYDRLINNQSYGDYRHNFFNLQGNEGVIADYVDFIPHFSDAMAYRDRGLAFTKLQKYSEALKDFNLSISKNYLDESTYNFRGQCYQSLGNENKAQIDFNMSRVLKNVTSKDYTNAQIECENLLKQNSNDSEVKNFLVQIKNYLNINHNSSGNLNLDSTIKRLEGELARYEQEVENENFKGAMAEQIKAGQEQNIRNLEENLSRMKKFRTQIDDGNYDKNALIKFMNWLNSVV